MLRSDFPSRERLMTMPINRLRQVDIHNLEEEEIVAEILSARMAKLPPQRKVKLRVPDINTPEEEKIWQARIDRLQAKQRKATLKESVDGEETKPLNTEDVFHGPNGDVELAEEEKLEDEQLDNQSSENDSSGKVISDDGNTAGDEIEEDEEDEEDTQPVLCVACGSKSRRHKKNCPTKLGEDDANKTESPT